MSDGLLQVYLSNALERDASAQERLDQIVLVGGAGAILASVSFVGGRSGTLNYYGILLLSWGLLLAAGLMAIRSLASTRETAGLLQNTYTVMIRADRREMTKAEYDAIVSANRATASKTQLALTLFGFGILALTTFAALTIR